MSLAGIHSTVTPQNSDLTELQKHEITSSVDISSYTSSNPYICPSDGYIELKAVGANNYIRAAIRNTDNTDGLCLTAFMPTGLSYPSYYNTCFVRKGSKVYVEYTSSGGNTLRFWALS